MKMKKVSETFAYQGVRSQEPTCVHRSENEESFQTIEVMRFSEKLSTILKGFFAENERSPQ